MCELCSAPVDRRTMLRRAALATTAAASGALGLAGPAFARSRSLTALANAKATTGSTTTTTARAAALATARTTTTAKATTRTTRSASGKSIVTPTIITRAEWGADEAVRVSGRAFAPIRKILVHHTASPNNPSDPAAEIRSIYLFHVLERGYVDIGYNFIVDHRGRIYEGRWALDYARGALHTDEDEGGRGVMGAHATGFNAGVSGIALLGDFSSGARPTTAAIDSLVSLIAWEASRHQIDPTGSDRFIPLFGSPSSFANIAAHSAIGQTDCPGPSVVALMPSIRQRVKDLVGSFPAQTVNIPATIRFRGDARAALATTPVSSTTRTTRPTTTARPTTTKATTATTRTAQGGNARSTTTAKGKTGTVTTRAGSATTATRRTTTTRR